MDNFQLIILCGGLASRIIKLTKKTPKSLLKFKKHPFIFYQLQWAKKNKIKNIILLTGHLDFEIKNYIKKNFKELNVFCIRDGKKLRGTGGAILNAKKYLKNKFMVINGDTYPMINIKNLINHYFDNKELSTVVIKKNNKKHLQSNIKIKNRYINFYEKEETNDSKYIDYGIQLFNKKDLIKTFKKKYYLSMDKIYLKLIKNKKLIYYKTNKNFFEIGSYKCIKEFKNYLSKK